MNKREKIESQLETIKTFFASIADRLGVDPQCKTVLEFCEDVPEAKAFGELQFTKGDRYLGLCVGDTVGFDKVGYQKIDGVETIELDEWDVVDESLTDKLADAILWLYGRKN